MEETEKSEEQPWYKDRFELRPMNETMAQGLLGQGGDALDKLEPREIANMQLAMERHPEAFSEAQRAQIKDLSWKMIDRVGRGDFILDPRESNNFKYMLDHVPATAFNDVDKMKAFKAAEQKWHDADTMSGERRLLTDEEIREGLKNGRVKRNDKLIKEWVKQRKAQKGNKNPQPNVFAQRIQQLRGTAPSGKSKPVQPQTINPQLLSGKSNPKFGGRP